VFGSIGIYIYMKKLRTDIFINFEVLTWKSTVVPWDSPLGIQFYLLGSTHQSSSRWVELHPVNIPKTCGKPKGFPKKNLDLQIADFPHLYVSFPQLKLPIRIIGFSATHLSCNNSWNISKSSKSTNTYRKPMCDEFSIQSHPHCLRVAKWCIAMFYFLLEIHQFWTSFCGSARTDLDGLLPGCRAALAAVLKVWGFTLVRPVVPGWMGEVAEFKTPEILKTEQVIYI
jgi:hypothetical protein